ncbi:hypothetical protein AwErysi_09740 [Erysipelotrichaceae bacterium]|nr:hypothetical protein AwErysi_09740 [Erysipelotrichaceae bacterium]
MSELQQNHPIMILLKISGVSKSTYYYTKNKDGKDQKNEELIHEIIAIYDKHKKRYGYRRITLDLRNKGLDGLHFSRHKSWRGYWNVNDKTDKKLQCL